MRVIGTAGHVDHGKSTLVKALTGIDPDRLKEEKAREMTIDLGFAYLTLPDDEIVGIVDVPGHKDFIGNMLAGVGAIDTVLFVVDANEGIMPQTREHLHILDQLHLKNGLIALTKCDLVENSEWLSLVVDEIKQELRGTFLSDAPIIKVSAKTGLGLKELKKQLSEILKITEPPKDINKPRLSIDRVFTLQGFGTIVTGTLLDGKLKTSDEIYISGIETRGRIRGLQSHNKKVDSVSPGSRIAINISGIEAGEIKRGDLLQKEPESGSHQIDAWVQLLPNLSRSLKHNDQVKVFHLAAENSGRIRLLGADEILPGDGGYVQIEFVTPVFTKTNDRFVIRFPSPSETIGGGQILHNVVRTKYKRFSREVISMLSVIKSGSLEEKISEVGNSNTIFSLREIGAISGYSPDQVNQKLVELINSGTVVELIPADENLNKRKFISKRKLNQLSNNVLEFLKEYHLKYPIRYGAMKEELSRSLKMEKENFVILLNWLEKTSVIKNSGNRYSLPDFSVKLNPDQSKKMEVLNQLIDKSKYSPPGIPELISITGQELFDFLLASGKMIRLTGDVAVRKEEFDEMLSTVTKIVKENGKITVSEFRDAFGSSRKYALAFLEYLDDIGVTRREGDYRILKNT